MSSRTAQAVGNRARRIAGHGAGNPAREDAVLRHLARPGVLTFPRTRPSSEGMNGSTRISRGRAQVAGTRQCAGRTRAIASRRRHLRPCCASPAVRRVPTAETRLLDDDIWLRDPSPEQISASAAGWRAMPTSPRSRLRGWLLPNGWAPRRAIRWVASCPARWRSTGLAGVLGLGLTLAGWIAPGFGFAVLAALLLAMEAVRRFDFRPGPAAGCSCRRSPC